MRHGLVLLSAVLLMVSLSACGKAPPREEPAPAPAAVALPGRSIPELPSVPVHEPQTATDPGVLLKVKWPLGSRYVYRMDLDQHSTNQMPDNPQPTHEDVTVGVTYALLVREGGTEGRRDLEMEFLAHDIEIKLDGQVVFKFDSAEPPTEGAQKVPAPFLKVVGSKVRLQVDDTGKVEKVLGLDAWVKNVAGDSPGPAGQMLVQQFNEGFFQQAADFARGLPEKPVQAGDCWSYKTEVPAGSMGKIAADSLITLKGWEHDDDQSFAILEAKGALKGIPAQETGATSSLVLDQGTITGTSWFDPQLGALIESAVEQFMQLTAEVPAPPAGHAAPSQFTSRTGQKVVVKLVELSTANR